MSKKWRDTDTLHYMLVGDANHAQELARWLVDYKDNLAGLVFEDEGNVSEPVSGFQFSDRRVTLGKHHQTSEQMGPITVNLRDSMAYITSEAD